jgi:uncharacterized protein
MPHKCTHCGEIFEDGSPEILKGCPACGGKKFLYVREEEHPVDLVEGKPTPVVGAEVNPPAGIIEELDGEKHADEEAVDQTVVPMRPAHKEREKDIFDRIESISINGPGSYEINIEKLAQNGGVVLGLGKEGQYAVDILSMGKLRKKNKK